MATRSAGTCLRESSDPGFAREKAEARRNTALRAWVCPREDRDPGFAREKAGTHARGPQVGGLGARGLQVGRRGKPEVPKSADMAEDALSAGQGGEERGHARQSAPAREQHALEAALAREKAGILGLPAKIFSGCPPQERWAKTKPAAGLGVWGNPSAQTQRTA